MRTLRIALALAVALRALTPGTGSAVGDRPARSPWGTLRGQVIWSANPLPKQKPLKVIRDQQHCLGGGPILSEDRVINPRNRGVRWTFVWLAPAGKQPLPIHPDLRKFAPKTVPMDIQRCQYVPHAVALRQGQSLLVRNTGPVAYNVNWCGSALRNPGGNVLVPPERTYTITGLKGDRLPVFLRDAIHPWMRAWVRIFDHPYYAVTDADGKFVIRLAPAGTWQLVVWQEATGWGPGGPKGMEVTLLERGETRVQVKLDDRPWWERTPGGRAPSAVKRP